MTPQDTFTRLYHATLVLGCIAVSATLFLLTFLAWEGWGEAQAPSRAWWAAYTCRDKPERCETRCPYANRPCIIDNTFTWMDVELPMLQALEGQIRWDKGPDEYFGLVAP